MARREQGPTGSARSCWPRIPHMPLKCLRALPTPPLIHTGSRALHSRDRACCSPLPAAAVSPLPSLTAADQLELFLLPPQVPPGHPCEHRACHGPGGTAPCQRRRRRCGHTGSWPGRAQPGPLPPAAARVRGCESCLLYTSDAADE